MAIGERIKEERQRLELSQEAFAKVGGASKRSQIDWEQNKYRPDADVLASWAAAGADVFYIIMGTRASLASPIDWVSIAAYLSDQLKAAGSESDNQKMRAAAFKSLVATAPSAEEVRLLMNWRRCDEDEREMLLRLAHKFADTHK